MKYILILQTLYFMLPAYVANMAPVFFRKVNLLNYPLDFNRKYKGQPILGPHKTFRGLVFGTLMSIITAYLQHLLAMKGIAVFLQAPGVDYSNWFWLGFLLGFGALFGDAVKSFFKRRVGINPGERFVPWDQLDFVFGSLIFVRFVYAVPFPMFVIAIIASFLLHIAANHIGFYLKIRKEKW